MQVKRLIIHELIKEAQSDDVQYKSSSNLVAINDGITKLAENIHVSFEQSITKYSKFDTSKTTNAVYRNIDKYLKTDDTDEQFITFSKTSLGDLTTLIKREPFATGGFYLFIDYIENGFNFISIIIVRNKDAFNIQWNGADFNVGETENINIEKLAMGFRINCGLYLDDDDSRNYLALISHQGDVLSRYFTTWVNAAYIIDNRTNTRQLIGVIKEIGAPVDYDSPDDFERNVYEWIDAYKKANKNAINVDALSDAFYGSRTYIRDYAQDNLGKEIDPIFKVSADELKKLIRFKATAKGISVSIDIERFRKEEVVLSEGMLIIKDEGIYNELLRQRNEQ